MRRDPLPTVYERSVAGRRGIDLPELDVPAAELPAGELREHCGLPELSELEVVRHYLALSQRNFGVDSGFYPLGSCTMKYNPKINEDMARLAGFARLRCACTDSISGRKKVRSPISGRKEQIL